MDMENPRRVAAALRRSLASGKTFDEISKDFSNGRPPFADYRKYVLLLDREMDDLKLRIRERAKNMVSSGLISEVERLLSTNGRLCPSAACAIGYRETIKWLKNPTTEEALADEIAGNTMKLVKKQRTWFKSQIPIDVRILLPRSLIGCIVET
jgi:tRNA dimethylallyltransferase